MAVGGVKNVQSQNSAAKKQIPFSIQYLVDKSNNLGIEGILNTVQQANFNPFQQTIKIDRHYTYWLKVDMSSILQDTVQNWALRVGEYTINTLYYSQNGNIEQSPKGDYEPIVRPMEDLYWRYHIVDKSQLIDGKWVYIKIRETNFPVKLSPSKVVIMPLSQFFGYTQNYRSNNISYYYQAILFLGGITFLFVYTFGIYFIYKDIIYLRYGIYLLSLLMYLGVKLYPGFSLWAFGSAPFYGILWNEVTQVLINYFYLKFVRSFLDTKNLYPCLDRIIRFVEWLYLGFLVLITGNLIIHPINTFHSVLIGMERFFMVVFAISSNIYILFNLKDKLGLFIVAGSSMLIIGSFIALYLTEVQYFMYGVITEVFIFAMGLGLMMKRREMERAELSREMGKVKMTALQTQMNPHFIFNSLNSIRSYIIKKETNEASAYLSKFSRLIRQILEYSSEEYITLKQELQILELYIQIEQLRFRDNFNFSIRVQESINREEILVPPLIFQPFLENAIWHGLMRKKGHKFVELSLEKKNNNLLCYIQDNGIGRVAASKYTSDFKSEKKSLAIDLTKKRLEILNRQDIKNEMIEIIDLYNEENKAAGTKVRLELPFILRDIT